MEGPASAARAAPDAGAAGAGARPPVPPRNSAVPMSALRRRAGGDGRERLRPARPLPVAVIAGVAAIPVAIAPGASPAASSTARTTLATFAGTWYGHTRSLAITPRGLARESISDGCCHPVVDLVFRLSRPRGTARSATATIRATWVRVHDRSAFTGAFPAPRVGEVRRLRLRSGVITEPLTGATYCDPAAGERGRCGA